jgi:hypothetical protein
MNQIRLRSRIDPDGVLRLDVPVGPADADRDVQITIEPVADAALARFKERPARGRGTLSTRRSASWKNGTSFREVSLGHEHVDRATS